MGSIAHNKGVWQELPQKPIAVYPAGITIHRQGLHFVPKSEGRTKRGEITSFTAAARRRLRHALLTLSVPDSIRLGITLTVPWIVDDFGSLMDEWRDCVNRFCVSFRRAYPHSGLIYRVELQRRGAPHLHALMYISFSDIAAMPGDADLSAPSVVAAMLQKINIDCLVMWVRAVPNMHHGNMGHFARRGVRVESLVSDIVMYRYICDHTSKAKQAQLGYKGKQWGIVGRANFRPSPVSVLPPFQDDGHQVRFMRLLRRVMRYRVKAPNSPFGTVLLGSRRSVGDFYLSPVTVNRMFHASASIVPRGTNC